MPPSLVPGWSAEQLEAHACAVFDREGRLVFSSALLERLAGSPPLPMGSPARTPKAHPDPATQEAIERWRAFVLSGAIARMGMSSGTVHLPHFLGGRTVLCRWQYFGIPESDPEYHLVIYEAIDQTEGASPEALARKALRMEGALLEIRCVVDGVGLSEPRREMPDPVDLAELTNRELDVMKQILDGKTNQQISDDLHVSLETVKSHAKAIFRKLEVHSRSELLSRFVTSLGVAGAVLWDLPLLV